MTCDMLTGTFDCSQQDMNTQIQRAFYKYGCMYCVGIKTSAGVCAGKKLVRSCPIPHRQTIMISFLSGEKIENLFPGGWVIFTIRYLPSSWDKKWSMVHRVSFFSKYNTNTPQSTSCVFVRNPTYASILHAIVYFCVRLDWKQDTPCSY